MTELVWDEVGERTYQAGIDHGVLYLGGQAVVWNGLTRVEDATPGRTLPLYQDGVKFFDVQQTSEFEGVLAAFTYPELFESALGQSPAATGLDLHDQYPVSFGLSYRTLLGDDVIGLSRGYVIHLLYNLYASANPAAFATASDTSRPVEFSWKLTSTPNRIAGRRPTAHLSIDSTKIGFLALTAIERALYGSDTSAPTLPSIQSVIDTINNPGQPLAVVNNGDGTWTATGSLLSINMVSESEFEITHDNIVMNDPDTYSITTP